MVQITVSDPRIEQPETRHTFTSYLVSTKEGNSVRRRYSDFRWLYQRLQTEVPGAIIPIIPHTRTLMSTKKFNLELIEERRRDLQEFLVAVTKHAELCRAPSMTPFMLLDLGKSFDDGKTKVEQSMPTTSEVMKWAEEVTNTEASKASVARKGIGRIFAKIRLSAGAQQLLTTEDESQIPGLYAYIAEVSRQAKALVKASDSLLKSTLISADAHHEIGVPIGLWKTTYMQQNGNQDDDVGNMMEGICHFSDEISILLRKKHKEEEFLFAHNVHKLANSVSAFEIALSQRKKAQVDCTHCNNTMLEKNAALEKAQKNLKPPEVTDKLNCERVELESRIEIEKERFDQITKRLLKDADKYKPRLVQMVKECFLMFAKAQISYTTRINEAYQRMLPLLEEVGSDDGEKSEDSGSHHPPSDSPPRQVGSDDGEKSEDTSSNHPPSYPPPPPPNDDGES
uniref:PX domain-containing protein n=1 Tax=Pseudo-nitzschia australis TaxID=44445 RepID=A0A7S4ARP2_9STRA|mmetsp:Transcript_25657/g.56262  ORF Transcript_25657/g.56262 Transcript_25657/m.56262 type:complete len:454 (-) Transcript_25657:1142-2503(-)